MFRLFKNIDAWRFRKQQRSLERWAQVRAKGKARFVFHQAMAWAVLMIVATDFFDHIFEDDLQVSKLRFNIIYYSVSGILLGLVAWSNEEGKYKRACLSRPFQTTYEYRITPR